MIRQSKLVLDFFFKLSKLKAEGLVLTCSQRKTAGGFPAASRLLVSAHVVVDDFREVVAVDVVHLIFQISELIVNAHLVGVRWG